jgi:hypothetical protein
VPPKQPDASDAQAKADAAIDAKAAELLAAIEARVTIGVAAGFRTALADEAVIEKAVHTSLDKMMEIGQRKARDRAGSILLGALWWAAMRLSMFVVLGLLIYSVGGWGALMHFLSWVSGKEASR